MVGNGARGQVAESEQREGYSSQGPGHHRPADPLNNFTQVIRGTDPAKQPAEWYAVVGFAGFAKSPDGLVRLEMNGKPQHEDKCSDQEMRREKNMASAPGPDQSNCVVVSIERIKNDREDNQEEWECLVGWLHQGRKNKGAVAVMEEPETQWDQGLRLVSGRAQHNQGGYNKQCRKFH